MDNNSIGSYNDVDEMITKIREIIKNSIRYDTPETEIKYKQIKNKILFNYDGYNLDLSYITQRIIAMAFPKLEYLDSLQNFFSERHQNKVKVYNLCSEFSYEENIFNQQAQYPMNDHEVSSLKDLISFCYDVDEWMSLDEENITAVHCKCGSGRTGLMICSYLLFKNMFLTPKKVMRFFFGMRTNNAIALKNPSQIRYLNYFHKMINQNLTLINIDDYKIELSKIIIRNLTETMLRSHEFCIILALVTSSSQNIENYSLCYHNDGTASVLFQNARVILSSDVKFYFNKIKMDNTDEAKMIENENNYNYQNIICSFFIHTYFIGNIDSLILTKSEIDKAFMDYNNNFFKDNFQIELFFNRTNK